MIEDTNKPDIDRIAELAQEVAKKIPGIFAEAHDSITEAINATVETAQEGGDEAKEAVLALSISVKWNMDTNKLEVKLPVKVVRNYSASGELPDHAQPALPLVDADGDPIGDRTRQAAAKLKKLIREGKTTISVVTEGLERVLNESGVPFVKGASL